MKTTAQQGKAAKEFADYWKDKGYEKGESQVFWLSLLRDVFGVEKPESIIRFESKVMLDHTSFIDGIIPSTHVLIEQKSVDKNLRAPAKQSDGSLLSPFQQAKRYSADLPYSDRPRWIVTSNFKSFLVYDMEQPNGEPEEILLENLEKEYYRLSFLVDERSIHLKKEMEISLKAGEIIGEIYDELLKQYINPDAESLKSLNVLCVRIVFCLYAEDAGVFGSHSMFHDYLAQFKPGKGDMREALIRLFEVLDTPMDKRDKYLRADLQQFPYCNGGLFSDKDIEIPFFNDRIAQLLLKNASAGFDWSEISPTIFGSVFESTLNPETRRKGGMHYTSIENIHKVIDPLFLDDLKGELEKIENIPAEKQRFTALRNYQDKLSKLKFLDPACGSGNFLTETYLSLRRLENRVLEDVLKGQIVMGFDEENTPVKVSIHQFYGIEINDFAVDVATTALWIAESQMLNETQKIVNQELNILPLKSYHNIKKGNALRLNWNEWITVDELPTIIADKAFVYPQTVTDIHDIVAEPAVRYNAVNIYSQEIHFNTKKAEPQTDTIVFDYIMGNPPFAGTRTMTNEQKDDVSYVFDRKWSSANSIDYVGCWYKRAADVIRGTKTKCAFVSTNSIVQGEQVTALWKPLIHNYSLHIDFAYQTFVWNSESNYKAHVHCVIIAFSCGVNNADKILFCKDGQRIKVSNINAYLSPADDVFVEKRQKPICDVPEIYLGCTFNDNNNLIMDALEKDLFIEKYPSVAKYIRPYVMGKDFIDRKPRFCFWLKDAIPTDIRNCPDLLRRIEKVKEFRRVCKNADTKETAELPALPSIFRYYSHEMHSDFIAIPKVSSQRRKYLPMELLPADYVAGDKIFLMPKSDIYTFGIMTSNVHMCWMRLLTGRLKSDYSYSSTIVYNTFPWPAPTESQRNKIKQTAQSIIDARNLYPECSLADLYDELTMPPELRKAHQANDRAVMEAYGFSARMSESECVAALMKMYEKLSSESFNEF